MRIISGKYRGKKLNEFELSSTKPTLDRVKESIFNLIQFEIADAVVLDLFAGTGALGIEAISRGAEKTYLVDSNKDAIKLIQSNLKGIDGNFVVEHKDGLEFLNTVKTKFDVVLLDPPYKSNLGILAINKLIEKNLLNQNAVIIFETGEDNDFDLTFQDFVIKKKKYGTVVVYKLEKVN